MSILRSANGRAGKWSAMTGSSLSGRCAAAHVADWRKCEGPHEVVRVVDLAGDAATGCVLHAAVLLASLESGRVYPGPTNVEGAAIEVYRRAQSLAPFDFLYGPGVAKVATVPDAAVFPHGGGADDSESESGGAL